MSISILYTYTCAYNFKGISINQEKEIYLPNKEYISGHEWEWINMVVKRIVHMHINAELKAHWLLVRWLWWSWKSVLLCLLTSVLWFFIFSSCGGLVRLFISLLSSSPQCCNFEWVWCLGRLFFVSSDLWHLTPTSVIACRVWNQVFWSFFLLEEVGVLKGLSVCSAGVSSHWAIPLGAFGVAMILALRQRLVVMLPAVFTFVACILWPCLVVWGLLRCPTAWKISASSSSKVHRWSLSRPLSLVPVQLIKMLFTIQVYAVCMFYTAFKLGFYARWVIFVQHINQLIGRKPWSVYHLFSSFIRHAVAGTCCKAQAMT